MELESNELKEVIVGSTGIIEQIACSKFEQNAKVKWLVFH
jgi:hypothetical protein